MSWKKQYGDYKTDTCPFCGGSCYEVNKVGIPVCKKHKDTSYPDLKCVCGNWLDFKVGKFGTYCTCPKCGNMNLAKAMSAAKEIGPEVKLNKKDKEIVELSRMDPLERKCKETGIRSWKDI